ncbi:hypothetical protein V6N13_063382 [Hibiscus sabdariffa]
MAPKMKYRVPISLWKRSTQGSYFEAISGVFPYPNGSCKKIGFHIELQIYAIGIGIGWLLLAPLRTAVQLPKDIDSVMSFSSEFQDF